MIKHVIGCSVRNYSRKFQVQTYNIGSNNLYVTYMIKPPFGRVLYSSNSFFHSHKTKYSLLANSCHIEDSSVQDCSARSDSFITYRHYSATSKSGIHSENVLFKNPLLYIPTKASARFQSTLTNAVHKTSDTEIIEEGHQSWFTNHSEGIELVLKDISESSITKFFEHTLGYVHSVSGLPWWGTIILTAVLFRTIVILPFGVHQRKVLVKLENAQRELSEISEHLNEEIRTSTRKLGWPTAYAKEQFREQYKRETDDILSRENVHPVKGCALVVLQNTMWLGMSTALANMCCVFPHSDPVKETFYLEMTTGGFRWMQNLTEVDSSLILPCSLGLINLAIVAVHFFRLKDKNTVQKFTLTGASLLSLGMVPLAIDLPAGIVLYWVVSSGYGLVYNLLLTLRPIRSVLGIPELKSDVERQQEVTEWLDYRRLLVDKQPIQDENVTPKEKTVKNS